MTCRGVLLTHCFLIVFLSFGCSHPEKPATRAQEGRGLLPRPNTPVSQAANAVFAQAFTESKSGFSVRELYESDKYRDSRIRITEFELGAGQGPAMLRLQKDAIIELVSTSGNLKIGEKTTPWVQGERLYLPTGTPIEASNPTDRELLLRAIVLEGAK